MGISALNGINAQQDSIVQAKIIDDGSQDAEKFYNQGIEYFTNKEYNSAIKSYDLAISLKPEFDKAYFNRGNTKFELKDYQGALSDLNTALNISQQSEYYFSRGQVRSILGHKGGAIEDYTSAITFEV